MIRKIPFSLSLTVTAVLATVTVIPFLDIPVLAAVVAGQILFGGLALSSGLWLARTPLVRPTLLPSALDGWEPPLWLETPKIEPVPLISGSDIAAFIADLTAEGEPVS